ncbi:MAG: FAD:protein FMN transferase [Elusimicrobiales bacterium]|jgi:thiamine biosynthesis lipoprotein
MVLFKKYALAAAGPVLALALFSCSKKEEPSYVRTLFIMGVPSQIRVFTSDEAGAGAVADAVVKEWARIAGEYNFGEPSTYTSYVNKKAYAEWVEVDGEFLRLLTLSLDYYKLTGGAFDITFAPLWAVWKEAASSRKIPSQEEISKALAGIGSEAVLTDPARKLVRFTKPVQINLGGLLRGYCLERGYKVLKETAADKFAVELRLGGNMLAYGKRDWSYEAADPLHEGRSLGRLRFSGGVVMSSSGRDHFVQIDGKLYSHILDLKTGYPLPDFSNLIVYYPGIDDGEYVPSAVLAVMGREKAFAQLGRIKGSAALWINGSGDVAPFINPGSPAVWEKRRSFF